MTQLTVRRTPSLRDIYPAPLAPGDWLARWPAALVFLVSVTWLGVAVWLTPDLRGHGTHEQLGLPPCGFLLTTRLPCATCGMTTAFALAAHGQLFDALVTQPAGALLALLAAIMVWISGYALLFGTPLDGLGRWLLRPRPILTIAGILLAAWVFKICMNIGVNG